MTTNTLSNYIPSDHEKYQRMVAEMSEIDPHELSAIFGMRPCDIPSYCRKCIDEPTEFQSVNTSELRDRAAVSYFTRLFATFAPVIKAL